MLCHSCYHNVSPVTLSFVTGLTVTGLTKSRLKINNPSPSMAQQDFLTPNTFSHGYLLVKNLAILYNHY